jgi:hypothetical protein
VIIFNTLPFLVSPWTLQALMQAMILTFPKKIRGIPQ